MKNKRPPICKNHGERGITGNKDNERSIKILQRNYSIIREILKQEQDAKRRTNLKARKSSWKLQIV